MLPARELRGAAVFRTVIVAAVLLVVGACSSTDPAWTVPASDSEVITRPEVARAIQEGASTAFEVIRWLRPSWVGDSDRRGGAVCVDGLLHNNARQTLENIPASRVNTVLEVQAVDNADGLDTGRGLDVKTLS